MKSAVLLSCLAAAAAVLPAQTATKPATSPSAAKSAATATKPATGTAASTAAAPAPWIKLPPGVPRVAVHGPVKLALALHYEDIKVGTGEEGEPNKLWHIKYTGWRAADGIKFDSWDDHPQPEIGPDGKLEMGTDGKPKMGPAKPMAFPQGMGRVIPGFDYGLSGMKIGGKRRIFIPWQLAYGTRAIPDRPDHPGIPAKSDLIFDVELVEVTDIPEPPHPVVPARPLPGVPPHPGAPGAAPAPGTSSIPPQTPGTSAPGSTAAPTAPQTTAQPSAPSAAPATSASPQPK